MATGWSHQAVLVDQAALDELRGEVRPTDLEIAVELAPHLGQLLADVATDDPGAVVRMLERPREHEFGVAFHACAKLAHVRGGIRVLLGGRPVAAHEVPQTPAVERRIERPRLVVEVAVDLRTMRLQSSDLSTVSMYPSSDTLNE